LGRKTLQATQRLSPWLVVSCFAQCFKAVIFLSVGARKEAFFVSDICTTVIAFCLFSYFLFYNLIVLRESHALLRIKLDAKKMFPFFCMHGLLFFFALLEIILKNVYKNTMYTGITSSYYMFETLVLMVTFNTSALRLIQFASANTKMMTSVSGRSMPTVNMSPLKKTMLIFTTFCVFVLAFFTSEIISSFSSPGPFPSESFGLMGVALWIGVGMIHCLGTVHAWFYLHNCKRRQGSRNKSPREISGDKSIQETRKSVKLEEAAVAADAPEAAAETEAVLVELETLPEPAEIV
jgi:hypothetical protein